MSLNPVDRKLSELCHVNSSSKGDDSTACDALNQLVSFTRGKPTASGNNGSTLDTILHPNSAVPGSKPTKGVGSL